MKTLKVQPVALCLFGLFFLARETETNSQGEKKKVTTKRKRVDSRDTVPKKNKSKSMRYLPTAD